MQRPLGFGRITAEAAQLQLQRIAAEAARAAAEAAAAAQARRAEEEHAALLRPGPGRPKLERNANDVLAAAPAAAAAAATEAPASTDELSSARKRGKYCNWFATPLIHDIPRCVSAVAAQRAQDGGVAATHVPALADGSGRTFRRPQRVHCALVARR